MTGVESGGVPGAVSRLGATLLDTSHCAFRVWAPAASRVEVHLLDGAHEPTARDRIVPLEPEERGYHSTVCDDVTAGTLYHYRLDRDIERPDPVSRHQPRGVHGPSAVVDLRFPWRDLEWTGLPLERLIFYELHVGTFTPEGTFEAVIPRLDALRELGINAIELMPVAQFPGERNWGYDGVYPFAVQNSYGGVRGLQKLVDACHRRGMALALDVVYNHLGPEGNYVDSFGPYFTERYGTPWGRAVNYDGAGSDEVRAFVVHNALQWVRDFHVDALRLDAIHGIFDFSGRHILEQLQDAVQDYAQAAGRQIHVIAESDLNDSRIIRPLSQGGYGLDAQWSDDFHHAVHTLLTQERNGYYADFGDLEHLVRAVGEGFVYSGQYSRFRRHSHGNRSSDLPSHRFVVCTQNHDQIGNRLLGDRLASSLDLEAQKLAAALLLLVPQVPLLFMGQEYGETAPFCYFVSHGDADLVEAVRRGRRAEFAAFDWAGEPPDPQDEATFERSRIDWSQRDREPYKTLLDLHRELLDMRRTHPVLKRAAGHEVAGDGTHNLLVLRRHGGAGEIAALYLLQGAACEARPALPAGTWRLLLDTADPRWRGPGSRVPANLHWTPESVLELPPWSCIVLERT